MRLALRGVRAAVFAVDLIADAATPAEPDRLWRFPSSGVIAASRRREPPPLRSPALAALAARRTELSYSRKCWTSGWCKSKASDTPLRPSFVESRAEPAPSASSFPPPAALSETASPSFSSVGASLAGLPPWRALPRRPRTRFVGEAGGDCVGDGEAERAPRPGSDGLRENLPRTPSPSAEGVAMPGYFRRRLRWCLELIGLGTSESDRARHSASASSRLTPSFDGGGPASAAPGPAKLAVAMERHMF
mmetsp:Transcript_35897/g.115452  ORF Transcript_35897/g.115452 Transcript_35897/m.115452 type:complete len:248 (+) Transcript_35897:895-1638(+)